MDAAGAQAAEPARRDAAGEDAVDAVARSYVEVAYPSLPHPRCHPDLIATHARLFGCETADLDACAVLEVGCWDGGHLIPLAEAYPGSRFTGVDLDAAAVARGRADIAALGLTNITLEAADVRSWTSPPGTFDYAIAHGVYAWTPPDVGEALMAAFARALREGGVALVSHNLAPGCHVRLMLRELLMLELEGIEDWGERMVRGRAALDEARAVMAEHQGAHAQVALAAEADFWAAMPAASLVHDLLAPAYAPVPLGAVTAHAARHSLAFLGDTDKSDVRRVAFPDALDRRMSELSGGDPVLAEHRRDLREARTFRHTLLRKGPPRARRIDGEAIAGMHVGLTRSLAEQGLPTSDADGRWSLRLQTEDFGATIEGDGPRGLLEALMAAYPATLPVRDLGLDRAGLGFVLFLYGGGAVKLWTRPSPAANRPGDRPAARGSARLQASRGRKVTRLDLEGQELDAMALSLLALCDGRSGGEEIARALAADTGLPAADILAALPANLDALAERALILADTA